ncbi:DUF3592 domain-containing protein [Kribbella sp. NPDC020789]
MAKSRAKSRRWAITYDGTMLLVAALVFAAIGWFQINDLYWLRHRGEVVTGTVIELSGSKTEHIKVTYVTTAGQTVTSETSNFEDGQVGQQIQVIYDRESPERMQAADWGLGYGFPAVGFSLAFLVFAAGGVLCMRE